MNYIYVTCSVIDIEMFYLTVINFNNNIFSYSRSFSRVVASFICNDKFSNIKMYQQYNFKSFLFFFYVDRCTRSRINDLKYTTESSRIAIGK